MSTLATVQSNYIPWKGYFDLVARSDVFVFRDDVQYTKDSWRNRNKIITPDGPVWLTIPVSLDHAEQLSSDIRIADSQWALKHWRKIEQYYRKAAAFEEIAPKLKALYEQVAQTTHLCPVNHAFIRFCAQQLNISTPIKNIEAFAPLQGDRNEKLIDLCKQAGCDTYLSGPAAQVYIDETLFENHGIKVEYMNYGPYPEYPQAHTPFVHEVSVIDLLFNTGYDAPRYMERAA